MKRQECCELTMVYPWQMLLCFLSPVFDPGTPQGDCRRRNFSLSQSKSPHLDGQLAFLSLCWVWAPGLPNWLLSTPSGGKREKENKNRDKEKRNHTEQTLVHVSHYLGVSIYLPFLLLHSEKERERERERYSSYRRKHNYLVFRNQMEAGKVQLL